MKKEYVLIAILFVTFQVKAQQWLEFTQQNHFNLFLNAAYTGYDSNIKATIVHRSQYTFLTKRAIASQFGEFSMPIFNKKYGIGVKIVNDFIGYQRYTLAELTGAYHLDVKKSRLSFGIGVGIVNLIINGSELRASGGDYENEAVIHNDEFLPNINIGGVSPTFSFGMLYKMQGFELGAAIQNINSPNINLLKSNSVTNVNIDRTINIHSSYVIRWTNVNIKPMVNYNTDFVKHQLQLGINTEINNIYFGLAFRGYSGHNNDAVMGEIGMKIKEKIRIGYSYDYNVSFLNKSNFGSHEISISYTVPKAFKIKNKGNVLFNPRFL